MVAALALAALQLMKRDTSDADEAEPEAGQREEDTSWSLFILIMMLIVALFVSYILQARKIQAIHETVISILSGSFVGLILRLTVGHSVLGVVTFDYQFFFNLLLPPIILASGYELHQGNFFRHIGTILTFAFAGTFISAVVLGVLLYLWSKIPLMGVNLSFVEAIQVGATLSATDPVTILAIFNTYKVEPKLYTVIFGESILNDAIAIVLFETAQRYSSISEATLDGEAGVKGSLTPLKLLESFGVFLLVFSGSLVIGLAVGIGTSLLLKFTYIRRYPKTESCIVFLIAYASYFFANAVHMSGIVSLLFCGICLKHYAYHNMSRRTQLTIKFMFQILAQLSENFIFIYLGISLFTEEDLQFQPLFILITVIAVCIARWTAVFPLAWLINAAGSYRARRKGRDFTDEMPWNHQAMLFWAGLRGAVGVALAAGLIGPEKYALKATVLVVVVLTVIIFGGTTAKMLEILNIRTGVVEDVDSDDEFDIEVVRPGTYAKRSGTAFGHNPKISNDHIPLGTQYRNGNGSAGDQPLSYSSGNARSSPPDRPNSAMASRKNSSLRISQREGDVAAQALLSSNDSGDTDEEGADLDLPPVARRPDPNPLGSRRLGEPARTISAPPGASTGDIGPETAGQAGRGIRGFLSGSTEDPATWFRRLDEDFIKPNLLLDPGDGREHEDGPSNV